MIASISMHKQKFTFAELSRVEKIKVKQCYNNRFFTPSYCPRCKYYAICKDLDS